MSEQVDLLTITAHPDDVEISMAGTVLRHIALGHSVGLVELTAGELGTRGTAEIRHAEAQQAMQVLGARFRYDLGLADGFFRADEAALRTVITSIRRHRPRVVLTNAIRDRHPDHGRGAALVAEACFLSGLRRIGTTHEGKEQEAWRSGHGAACRAGPLDRPGPDRGHHTVLGTENGGAALLRIPVPRPEEQGTQLPIATADFMPFLEGRAREMGRLIGTTFGEGFTTVRPPAVNDLFDLG